LAPFVESGKVRGLVLLNTTTRLKSMPEMQTSAEVGMSELTIPSWMGFLAPKGTPPAVIDKLDKAVQAALTDPKTKEVFDRLSFEPLGIPGPQFAARLKADSQVWGEVVRKANIKPEQ
jgi:tripartite-type tricarboxylate transporter receptor subunit TctC